jgi:hypothetical protein
MPQTSYSIYQDKGFEGMIANSRHNYHIRGTHDELVNGDTAMIPFGRVVRSPSATGEVLPLSADAQTMGGVTVYSAVYEKDENGNSGYPVDKPMSLMTEGEIFVIAEVDVAITDTVFARFLMNGSPGEHDAVGRVRDDADSGGATQRADAVPNAKFLHPAKAGEVVRVYVNF